MEAIVKALDVEDGEVTQRLDIPMSLIVKDDEIAAHQLIIGRLKSQREQLMRILREEREEIARQKATIKGLEKKCAIYETMVGDLMAQLETSASNQGG